MYKRFIERFGLIKYILSDGRFKQILWNYYCDFMWRVSPSYRRRVYERIQLQFDGLFNQDVQ